MPLSLTLHSHLWRSAALLIACQLPNQRSCKTTRLNWRSLFVIVIWSWQNGKQYFEEINVYFVINGDLIEKLVVCFWSKSHCYLEYKTWSIRHRPTGLCPNLRRQNYNKTRPKSVHRCSSQTYCHIYIERFLTQKCVNCAIFTASWPTATVSPKLKVWSKSSADPSCPPGLTIVSSARRSFDCLCKPHANKVNQTIL